MRKIALLLAALVAALAPTIAVASGGGETVVISGSDRYATAAQLALADGTSTATLYVASGESLSDAVVAGVAADDGDKILLVKRDTVPRPTVAALRQITRTRTVFLGGDDAISPSVRDQVSRTTPICAGDEECW